MLMAAWGITEPDAFRWLQRTAMDHRTSMLQVATTVIDNHHAAVATRPAAPTKTTGPGAGAAGPAIPAGRR